MMWKRALSAGEPESLVLPQGVFLWSRRDPITSPWGRASSSQQGRPRAERESVSDATNFLVNFFFARCCGGWGGRPSPPPARLGLPVQPLADPNLAKLSQGPDFNFIQALINFI